MYKREMHRRMDYPRKANTHIIEPVKYGGGGGPAMKKDFEKLYIGDPRGVKPTKNNEMPIGRGLPKTTLKFKY